MSENVVTYHTPEEVLAVPGQAEPVLILRHETVAGALFPSDWEVWLEPTARGHADGLCVGSGVTRDLALADAVRTLQGLALEALLAR